MTTEIETYVAKFWELYKTQDKPIVLYGNYIGDGIEMPLPIPKVPSNIKLNLESHKEQDNRMQWAGYILDITYEHGYLDSYPDCLVFHKSSLYKNILGTERIDK